MDSAVCPISSRIGESAASTTLLNAELMASVMQAPISVIPQSESLSSLPLPGCCGPVLLEGGALGWGMQSSPVHGVLGVVAGRLGVDGIGDVGCVGVGVGGPGFGVGGCADALIVRTPVRNTTMVSASNQPAPQRGGRPVAGRSAPTSEIGESITRSAAAGAIGPGCRYGRTVGGVLADISQAPTMPLRISTTSGASAARP
ncbi:hypothetical protein ACXIZN_24575 [Amycolatopsis sp. TRM77291]